jgi:hypothetical protein
MPLTRKSHPPSLKAKVAIKGHKTTAQIAQMFGVQRTPSARQTPKQSQQNTKR